MADILQFVKEVKEEIFSFKTLPAKNFDIDQKILYIKALSLIANVNSKPTKAEIDLLNKFLISFELRNTDALQDILAFGENPEKDTFLQFIEFLDTKEKKTTFLLDCFLLTNQNKNITKSSIEFLNIISETIGLSKNQFKHIENIYNDISSKRLKTVSAFVRKYSTIKKDSFSYLIDYYNNITEYILAIKQGDKCQKSMIL